MDTFIVKGGKKLEGEFVLGGAKNVALKVLVASLLTDEQVVFHNIPHIQDVHLMIEVLRSLGAHATLTDHTLTVQHTELKTQVPLELGARLRTSSMVIGPLLARCHDATIPNPGGCRIGARPIDRHIEGLKQMGATISYESDDGFFHAKADTLHGVTYTFPKNTHTGTETLLLAAVLATGTTILKNAAEEVEVDDLIGLLVSMGANVKRTAHREITIEGVPSLHGTEYTIMSDRNEEATIAVAAALTDGHITVKNSAYKYLGPFIEVFEKAGGKAQNQGNETIYSRGGELTAQDVVTQPHPGFMTDWQAPWAVFMTQAHGTSTIHETVFESRFSYVSELTKMGAEIEFFDPVVENPAEFYNFNWEDRVEGYHQGIRITGPAKLHNAILEMDDLRAGATLVLASLIVEGESYIHGVEQIDRGYERIEERLRALGAEIKRVSE